MATTSVSSNPYANILPDFTANTLHETRLKEAFIKALAEEQVALIKQWHLNKWYNLGEIAKTLFNWEEIQKTERCYFVCNVIGILWAIAIICGTIIICTQ